MIAGAVIIIAVCVLAAFGLIACELLPGTRAGDRLAALFGGDRR